MSKNFIWILSILMFITLFWFIYIQIKWIDGAMEVRERQFVSLVNTSLQIIANEVEQEEVVSHITREAFSFDVDSLKYSSYKDTCVLNKSMSYANNNTIFIENVVNQTVRKEINIKDRLNRTIFEEKVRTVLKRHNVNFDYEFAVTTQSGKVYFKSNNFDFKNSDEIFEVELYPNDLIYKEKHFLYIYFPNEKDDIFFTLPKVAFSTLFITLAIMTIFLVTLFIIMRQKKLSEMKNDFINNLTHELKTPISTISLASQMLKDEGIPAAEKDYKLISHIIDDETKRLGFQVEKILQMAILEKGYVQFKEDEIDINELLTNIINSFAIKIQYKEGKIEKQLDAQQDTIIGDELHITNVFYNLIDNAIKYSKEAPIILIKTSNCKEKIIISVQDNGIGIKKDEQKRIFNKFYRISTGDIHNVKGFGLGLSYVKRIVEEHKGKIEVNSQRSKGTTFNIELKTTEKLNI